MPPRVFTSNDMDRLDARMQREIDEIRAVLKDLLGYFSYGDVSVEPIRIGEVLRDGTPIGVR